MGIDEELAGPEYMARHNLIRHGWIELSDGALLPPDAAEIYQLKAENERLRARVEELEAEERAKLAAKVVYSAGTVPVEIVGALLKKEGE